jgi:hypothetical protein
MMTGKMGDRDSPEEIRRVFKLFDDDETGKISFRNLKRVARELGENMTDEELQEMINKVRQLLFCECLVALADMRLFLTCFMFAHRRTSMVMGRSTRTSSCGS